MLVGRLNIEILIMCQEYYNTNKSKKEQMKI